MLKIVDKFVCMDLKVNTPEEDEKIFAKTMMWKLTSYGHKPAVETPDSWNYYESTKINITTKDPSVNIVIESPYSDNYAEVYVMVNQTVIRIGERNLFFGKQSYDCTPDELNKMCDDIHSFVLTLDDSEITYTVWNKFVREWSMHTAKGNSQSSGIIWQLRRFFIPESELTKKSITIKLDR